VFTSTTTTTAPTKKNNTLYWKRIDHFFAKKFLAGIVFLPQKHHLHFRIMFSFVFVALFSLSPRRSV